MKKIFAVIRNRTSKFQSSLSLEEQPAWREHADFMDTLYVEGFVLLVGPLEGSPDVLIIVRAESPEEIERRFADDPWSVMEILRTTRIAVWTLRLGSFP
jgi:uncharacterized protein YciI